MGVSLFLGGALAGRQNLLPNDRPAVIASLTFPKACATGVQPTTVPQIGFTEPVTHISDTSVRLTDATGTPIPLAILGAGLAGPIEHPDANAIVTGLTLQPTIPLDYTTTYTLTLTNAIVDTDVNPTTGAQAPKALIPYTTTFTTFAPSVVGQTGDTFTGGGLAVVDDRAYVAQNDGNNSVLRLFDVSDPTVPVEITPNAATGRLVASPPVRNVGHPADVQVQDHSPVLEGGRLAALALTNFYLPYHPSNLYLYDVTSDQTWSWVGAVTLGTNPLDGMVRRIKLKDGFVYAATTGIGKGIQVVHLPTAVATFQTATAGGEGSPLYADMERRLGLASQGFGQEAIVQTIFVPSKASAPASGPFDPFDNNAQVWDLDVIDLLVDHRVQPIVVATGRAGLTIANPLTVEAEPLDPAHPHLLWNSPTDITGVPMMGWGAHIAAGVVAGRPIAAVLGYGPGPGAGVGSVVVIVDLTDPRQPRLLSTIPVSGVTLTLASDLAWRGDRLYVGGDTHTTVISAADPSHPEVLGVVQDAAGRVALTDEPVLFSSVVGWGDVQSAVGGLRITKLADSFCEVLPVRELEPEYTDGDTAALMGWQMHYEISADDGLVLSKVYLGSRLMAERMSVPYFTLSINRGGVITTARCQLLPNGDACEGIPHSTSRLVAFTAPPTSLGAEVNRFEIVATYQISGLCDPSTPDQPDGCLQVTQRYQFWKEGLDDCETLGEFTCARFKPMIEYRFTSTAETTKLEALTVPERLHFTVVEPSPTPIPSRTNAVVFLHDCDSGLSGCFFNPFRGDNFSPGGVLRCKGENPLEDESLLKVIEKGTKVRVPPGSYNDFVDNYHQSSNRQVDEPALNPGCPDCVHIHWRWAEWMKPGAPILGGVERVSPRFNNNFGLPIIPAGSTQDVALAVVRYNQNELDPPDYTKLVEPAERIIPASSASPVLWYAATGRKAVDRFMIHGGFFSSQGGLPAIASLGAEPASLTAGQTAAITFAVSGMSGHQLRWTATLNPGASGSLETTTGTVTAPAGGKRDDVSTFYRTTQPEDAVVTVTLTDTNTDPPLSTQQILRITVR